MLGGDISNATPRRLIVVADVIGQSEVETNRKLFKEVHTRTKMSFDNRVLSYLWRFADQHGLAVELVAFEDEHWSQEYLDKLMERLDARGANPFNYAEVYPAWEDFVNDLPYRPNLQGVVDLPNRSARYGSFYFSLNL